MGSVLGEATLGSDFTPRLVMSRFMARTQSAICALMPSQLTCSSLLLPCDYDAWADRYPFRQAPG